jgi:hypothetical protein
VPVLDSNLDDLDDAIRLACDILAPAAQPRRIRFVEEIDLRENKISRSKAAP